MQAAYLARSSIAGPPYYWNWTDWAIPGINVTHYVHWGVVQDNAERGPTNSLGQCGIAQYTAAYGSPSAWGWEAASCTSKTYAMCKILRERQRFLMCCAVQGSMLHYDSRLYDISGKMPCQVVPLELACPLSCTLAAVGSEPDAMYTSGFYSRFTFVSKELSSSDAEDYCQMLGGHLASFQNDQEQVGPVSKFGTFTCMHMHGSEICPHSHSYVLQLVAVQRLLAACINKCSSSQRL